MPILGMGPSGPEIGVVALDPEREVWGLGAAALYAVDAPDYARAGQAFDTPLLWVTNLSGNIVIPPRKPAATRPQEWGYAYVDWRDGIGSDVPDMTTIRFPSVVVAPVVWPEPEPSGTEQQTYATLDWGLLPVVMMPSPWQDYIGW